MFCVDLEAGQTGKADSGEVPSTVSVSGSRVKFSLQAGARTGGGAKLSGSKHVTAGEVIEALPESRGVSIYLRAVEVNHLVRCFLAVITSVALR